MNIEATEVRTDLLTKVPYRGRSQKLVWVCAQTQEYYILYYRGKLQGPRL